MEVTKNVCEYIALGFYLLAGGRGWGWDLLRYFFLKAKGTTWVYQGALAHTGTVSICL